MVSESRSGRRKAAAVTLAGLAALAWTWRAEPAGAAFVPRPLARELRDLAVDCLAVGTVQPALSALSEAEFAAIVEILGRLISAYGSCDYESFLALRAGDLESASERRAGDLERLREFGRELALSPEQMRGDWVATLGAFWSVYYERPAVARFLPEHTLVELHAEGLGARSLESWRQSFVALRDRLPGSWIQHDLCLPHRRSIEQVARDCGPLRWLDLELHFETFAGLGARLLARFVWDGVLREWFLQDAASVYATGDRSQRHLIL
ncbi:MAG: hypothetical protein HOP15_11265 [Planctomycetes bacterium]|nr:hypothetical protein [Planctomycetota bacterium]